MRVRTGLASMVLAAAVAVPAFPATAAAAPGGVPAAPAASCHDPGPWNLHGSSARIHARPSKSSPALGVLYPKHKFKVLKERKGWVKITDRSTGVTGWVSDDLVYRDVRMCLS